MPESMIVGRYRLLRVIGVGGMGSVYEATHTSLGMRVAVKTLKPALADNTITSTRFLREGVVAAKIRHPNAVSVYDVIEERGVSYLVMEYLEGETLKDLLDREAPLTPSRAADLMLPVASAVSAAHDEGIVHRDLKPSNIILALERTGMVTPKVLDFGLSWAADEDRPAGDITRSGVVLGTLLYMAPEQVRNARQASAASDQYALAVILYQAVTGVRPFLRETQFDMMNAVVSGQHAPLRAVRPELSAELEAVIERAMHVDPSLRYPSVHAFSRALLAFASPHVQALWAPVFDLPPPQVAAPVSSLVAVTPSPSPPPQAPPPAAAQHPETPASWLAKSPSRAVLIGGVACVTCLAVGLLIGASASHAPPPDAPAHQGASNAVAQSPQAPAPPPSPAPQAPAQQPPSTAQAAPPPAANGAARTPVVQQLRLDPALPVALPATDAGVTVPRYASPQFLDRTRQQLLQQPAPPDEHHHGDHSGER
ncbi:MAG: serine/threonine-protein kinase [Polyangiales bacterium]